MYNRIISSLNILFYYQGIQQKERLGLLKDILIKYNNNDNNINYFEKNIFRLLNKLDYDNKDCIINFTIKLCNIFDNTDYNIYYIPPTISTFISELIINNEKNIIIDPLCGIGNMLLYNKSKCKKKLWDIDKKLLNICDFNYIFANNKNYIIEHKNCLKDFIEYENDAEYVVLNILFNYNISIDNKELLDNFELGKGKNKIELGILFIELALRLLKEDGILFIIIPTYYIDNIIYKEVIEYIKRYRIVASIKLPNNTFKRSDIILDVSLLIIQKTITNNTNYEIFVENIDNIGYDLTKKHTPCKYVKDIENGGYVNLYGIKVLENDLEYVYVNFSYYCKKNRVKNIHYIDYNYVVDYNYILSNNFGNISESTFQ